MSRQFYGVPQWVVMYVSSLFCGYGYRAAYIGCNEDNSPTAARYKQINGIIDGCMETVNPHERDVIFRSIQNMSGYNNAYGFYGKKERFYAIKAAVVRNVAAQMGVI